MTLIKWRPFADIDEIFEREFVPIRWPKIGWDLAADVYEEKGNIVAKLNLPGIDPEKIDISVEGENLRISGSREEEKETKDKNYYSKEIRRGSFERTIALPAPVKADGVEAEYKDGVLIVTLPKKETEPVKKIKVKTRK